MINNEKRIILIIAIIFSLRMLGLFSIMPTFTTEAFKMSYANSFTVGLALGIYGLTQAIFQIPLGTLSDKIGRKSVIILGLIIFAIGSLVAAMSNSIYGVIIGRSLQGAGAIGSTLLALLADSTSEKSRLKGMAIVGITIGSTFVISIIIGPILTPIIGLSGIFLSTSIYGILGILLIYSAKIKFTRYKNTFSLLEAFKSILTNPNLLKLNLSVLILHAALVSMFIIIPDQLNNTFNIKEQNLWLVYTPPLTLALLVVFPLIMLSERKNFIKSTFIFAIFALALSLFIFLINNKSLIVLELATCIFFIGFTLLEALIPSLVSKNSLPSIKGTTMSIYSSFHFLGIFVGGIVTGTMFKSLSYNTVLTIWIIIIIVWLLIATSLKVKKSN